MNSNRYKIILFCVLSFLLGWFVGHHLCRGHHDRGCCQEDCCGEGGSCDMAHGGHGDMDGCKMHGHGMKSCCMDDKHMEMDMEMGEGHEARVHTIIHKLKESGFQGDT